MEYPKRPIEHVKQSASWKIFQNSIPALWIIRELTERDYGIDSYIEIVFPDGKVTGELCSIQLKGIGKIDWKEDPTSKEKKISIIRHKESHCKLLDESSHSSISGLGRSRSK